VTVRYVDLAKIIIVSMIMISLFAVINVSTKRIIVSEWDNKERVIWHFRVAVNKQYEKRDSNKSNKNSLQQQCGSINIMIDGDVFSRRQYVIQAAPNGWSALFSGAVYAYTMRVPVPVLAVRSRIWASTLTL